MIATQRFKKLVLAISLIFATLPGNTFAQCNTNTSICTSGTAGPFNFVNSGTAVSTCLDWIGPNTGYILLNITTSGNLNMLIDGNSNSGFLDVAVFNIPNGVAPCTAIQSTANQLGCNYASAAGGCNQFGNAFGCSSSVPAPAVYAGQTLMIVVENWSGSSSNFTLQLGPPPGAQTGPPNPTINAAGPFCTTSGPFQMTAVNQGGTWSGTGVSPTGIFNPATAGPGSHNITYSIGAAPCNSSSTSAVLVYANTPPTVTPSTTICGGGSATLTASGATSYTWSPATGLNTTTGPTVIATPAVTTTYTVTGTTAGCSNTATTTVTISPPLTINVPPATICAGSSATLTATGATDYTWSPATGLSTTTGSSVTASPPTTTTYTVTGTTGVCTGNTTTTVTVNPQPTVTATPITICAGSSGTLTASGATSYTWSPATGLSATTGASVTANPATTTTYTVTGTTGSCSNTTTVTATVNPVPVVTATPASQTICSGAATSIALSSVPAGATFDWTVAQAGVSGASNGTGSSITQTLTATGATAGTATYTITPTIGSCPGTPITVTITVNPTPVITATPASQTICSGTAPNIALTSVPAGATFDWTVAQSGVSGASNGSGATINQTLTATGAAVGTATYTITPTIGSCPGTPIVVPITVNPTPTATATPTSQTICSGSSTGIALASVPAGATFDWTVVQSGTTGASAGSGISINQTLITAGVTGTATYTIIPSLGICPGAPIVVDITVNPTPTVTATPMTQAICSGTAPNIALTSAPSGATFSWTISQTGASGASNGTGSTISQTLTATGTAAGTVTYTVVPMIGTCPGTPIDVLITVNPTPVVTATPASQAICSGTSTGITLTSVPAGATFDWTVAQSGTTGASAGNGSSINQTLSTAGVTGTATYTITPMLGTCPGTSIDVVITVNPAPVVTATPASQTICSGTAPNIALTSVPAGATFDWTVVQSGTTGASAGSGSSINQTLSTSGVTGTATYTITPMLGVCPGTPIDVVITVNPTPVVTATPASQAICSGTSTGITLTSVPAGATFDWTVAQSGTTGASAGSGTSISQVLSTSGTAVGTATYTITPTIGTCPGTPIDVVITVNPTPVVTATPASQTICSGTSTGITLTSVPAGATFDWTVAQSGTTGASAGSGSSINQTLSTAGVTGTATYTITPMLGTCPGTPIDVVITVNPTPVVTATPASQAICSGTSTGITLSSVPAGATFDWTVVQSGTSGASAGSGTSISQVLSTSGTAVGTATYTITPTIGTCPGTPIDVVITVNPTPVVTATPASQTICSGTSTGITLSSVPAGATFDWTVVQSGTTGASAGSGTSINQTLSTASVTGTATYTVTPTLGTCPGTPIDVVITVNPAPVVTATPTTQTICSGTAPNIVLSSVPAGATFNWTISQTGATGASNGTGNSISQTLTATGTTAGTAVYTVVPMLGLCPGSPVDVTITVNPTPVVTATPPNQTICSGTAPNIALTSIPTGATFDWTVVQSGTTGASAGSGATISQVLTTAAATGTATYTVTPTLGVCPGTPIDVIITVNPTPVVTATPASQTICSGTAPNIALTSVPAGSTFDWTVVQSGTTGASAGSGSSISQVLSTAGVAGTATYTITPMLGVCPGTPIDVVITVNPTPVVTATPANQTICSGTSTGIALTSVPAGATFDWTVVQSGTTGASAGSGSNINQTLTTAAVTGTATYTITPMLGVCPGTPIDVVITVNPTPVVTATPSSQSICSGTSTGITLTSVPAGATFNWTVVQSGTTGASAGTGTSIAQVLSTAGVIGTATYTITPTLGVCPGTPIDVVITVNPNTSCNSNACKPDDLFRYIHKHCFIICTSRSNLQLDSRAVRNNRSLRRYRKQYQPDIEYLRNCCGNSDIHDHPNHWKLSGNTD